MQIFTCNNAQNLSTLELIASCIYVMSVRSNTHVTETASIRKDFYLHLHVAGLPTPENIPPVEHTPYAKRPFSMNVSLITRRLRSMYWDQNDSNQPHSKFTVHNFTACLFATLKQMSLLISYHIFYFRPIFIK